MSDLAADGPLYSLDSLYAHAEETHSDTIPVDTDELIALLAEFRRLRQLGDAAHALHDGSAPAGDVVDAVERYREQRVRAGLPPREVRTCWGDR